MPELPEVETVRRDLKPVEGQRILLAKKSSKNLRKALRLNALSNKKITGLSRWGKKLIINLEKGHLDISLGMTGNFRIENKEEFCRKKHDHVFLYLNQGSVLIYNDSRRFGWVQYREIAPQNMGFDPLLSDENQLKSLIKKSSVSNQGIYSFLMDQSKVAGLGNIYVQEILFTLKTSPFVKTRTLGPTWWKKFSKVAVKILNKALQYGGSTIVNYQSLNGKTGDFQSKLKVYGRAQKNCTLCKNKIIKTKISSRTVYLCTKCQKL